MAETKDWRNSVAEVMTEAQTAKAKADAANAKAVAAEQGIAASSIVWVADVAITYSGLIALNLAPRTKTFDVVGAAVGDRVYVHRTGYPTAGGVNLVAGIIIEGTGFVGAAGKVDVYHVIPALSVGQNMSIPLKLVGYRPAT